MSTIVTRSGKGSPLTHNEVDTNFTNLNTDKVEKTAADITGGTINNTTIGATTPSTGVFTTLTATGQTSLGGVADSESLRVLSVASAVNYLTARGAASGSSVTLGAAGLNGGIATIVQSKGSAEVILRTNGGNQTQLVAAHTASAVNYVQVTGSPTSNSPQIQFTGSDAGVGGALIAKGNGAISFFNNGATTSRQFRVGAGVVTTAVNYINADGSATGNATQFQTLGTDTNIAMALRTSGTGAIDLAAGSRGVNISNGGTVTAITRTANGSGYTSIPSLAISAPTTAGGVQATATANMLLVGATVQSGGTGYTAGNTLTVVGGTGSAAIITVSTVSAGVITAITINSGGFGNYSVLPTNPVSVTGGTGTGATFNLTSWGLSGSFTITNAGSGYVEQPTVTFSGGGGSGAAAYATVGSGTIIRSLGATGAQSIDFQGASSINTSVPTFRIRDAGGNSFLMVGSATDTATLFAQGATNAVLTLASNGTQSVRIGTNGSSTVEQMRVSHTASAVNYVQVTGGVTAGGIATSPTIGSQGSDANVSLNINGKGNGGVRIGAQRTNFVTVGGSGSGGGLASFTAEGGDTNIDLALTPKGTGNVRFGTYTGTISAITGYIEIKDSGGTVRRLAVVA